MKITVVGSGFVGQTTAMRLLEKGLGEVVLIDIIEGKPQGLALDLRQAAPVEGYEPSIVGHERLRRHGRLGRRRDHRRVPPAAGDEPDGSAWEERRDHARRGRERGARVPRTRSSIIVSNPLDEMTFLAAEESGFPRQRVMGMAGVLDSARLRCFHRRGARGSRPSSVEAMTLGLARGCDGGAARQATVDGRRCRSSSTRRRSSGCSSGPATGVPRSWPCSSRDRRTTRPAPRSWRWSRRSCSDTKEVLPVCAWTTGEYGIDGRLRGRARPSGREARRGDRRARSGRRRARAKLREAAESIRAKCADLADL